MRFDFKSLSVFFVVVFLFFSLFAALVTAGVLNFNVKPGSQGSIITVSWSQGCPNYGLGPDQCASSKPLYCPKNSKGTDNDKLVDNCQKCGCPTNYECKPDGSCRLCDNPCSPDPCGSCSSCTVIDRCAGTYSCDVITPCCGNGVCESGETCSSCEADCGACSYCGDGVCNVGEDCSSCSSDCGGCAYCESAEEEGGGLCISGGTSSGCSTDNDCA